MKNAAIIFIALVTLGNLAFSKSKKETVPVSSEKVLILVNTAKWCPVCQANGERVEKEILSQYMKNEKCHIVVNDLSTEESKAASMTQCNAAGIAEVATNNKATGMIYFINQETKEITASISVTKPTEEIKAAFDKAIAQI